MDEVRERDRNAHIERADVVPPADGHEEHLPRMQDDIEDGGAVKNSGCRDQSGVSGSTSPKTPVSLYTYCHWAAGTSR